MATNFWTGHLPSLVSRGTWRSLAFDVGEFSHPLDIMKIFGMQKQHLAHLVLLSCQFSFSGVALYSF